MQYCWQALKSWISNPKLSSISSYHGIICCNFTAGHNIFPFPQITVFVLLLRALANLWTHFSKKQGNQGQQTSPPPVCQSNNNNSLCAAQYAVFLTVNVYTASALWRTRLNYNGNLLSLYLPLCENMTSSTKAEVLNVLYCRQKRTEPRPQVTCTNNFMKFERLSFWDMRANIQTYRHVDHNT